MKKHPLIRALIAALCIAASLNGFAGGPARPTADALSNDEISDLVFMREEEKVARDAYLDLMEQWDLLIFANIAESEQRHMDAVENLVELFGLADPVVDETDRGNFTDPELQLLFDDLKSLGLQSMMDGLMVGALIEETDIADLQDAIGRTTHENIRDVYENLMCGSRNHLRAFVGQIGLNGGDYAPAVLDETEFDEIVGSPMEKGCGNSGRKSPGPPNGRQ
jgi:hypothetical protein